MDKNQAQIQLWPVSQRLDYFQCFSCRFIPTESMAERNYRSKNASSSDFVGAITTICSSDILSECEFAIRVVIRAWLNSPGDPLIEEALTQPSVVEAILEVLFASTEDEILELIISILAELIGRNDAIRQIILNSDPQLEVFMRLLRSTSLFLKAAVLLYLSKPQAKQMISSEWVPLILRVLEFGDKLQTLFTVQCSPREAAFYILDQLLTGFDEDKNLENARQVLSLGGLTLLMRRIEEGVVHERNNSALIISCCIRAEGSCRSYLADNINKTSLLELIVFGRKQNSSGYALSVLVELLYLDRHVLFSYLPLQIYVFSFYLVFPFSINVLEMNADILLESHQKNQDFEFLKRAQRWMGWLQHKAHFLQLPSEGSTRRTAFSCSDIIAA